jgi:hypothetical protein
MIKIVKIVSDMSAVPIAEVRTDGEQIEFIVDNTNGELPHTVGRSFSKLQNFIANSSHLRAEESKEATAHFVRYLMNNGEVIEMTTDQKTILVNGVLLDEPQKNALFQMLNSGTIKIVSSSDETKPIPVPSVPNTKKLEPIREPREVIHYKSEEKKRLEALQKRATPKYDPEIEHSDYSSVDNPEFTKKLWYFLKYGDRRNGR